MATDKDKAEALEKFIAEKSLHVGVARVANVYDTVKASGYPTTYGIDVDGKVIWRGHPQNVNDALVQGWLKDMRKPRIPRKLPDALAGAVAAYDGGRYGAALEAAEKAQKDKNKDVQEGAAYLLNLLQGRMEMHKARAQGQRTRNELDRLVELLEGDATDFEGTDYAKDCGKEAKKLKDSKAYKDVIAAAKDLAELKPKLANMKPKDAKKALEGIARKYEETPAGKEASELLKSIKE